MVSKQCMKEEGKTVLVASLKNVFFVGIDDLSLTKVSDAGLHRQVVKMNMTVDHMRGVVFLHQLAKDRKSCMRQIRIVPHTLSRGVSQQDIKATVAFQGQPQLADPPFHLNGSVLMTSFCVTHGASQPKDPQTLIGIDLIFDTDTSLWRFCLIGVIMVAVDIEDRYLGHGGQKGQVLRGEITAGEDQINIFYFVFFKMIPQIGGFLVGESQYPHGEEIILS